MVPMVSKRYESLKKAFSEEPSLVNLLDFLEIALLEQQYGEIIRAVEDWEGPFTVDIDYYWGVALAETDKKKEGIAKLKSVIAVNANHFKAKLKLDEYGEPEESDEKPKSHGISIKLPEVRIEDTPSFQNARKKKILFIFAIIAVSLVIIISLIKTTTSNDFKKELSSPDTYLISQNYSDFEKALQKFRVLEAGNQQDIAIKKIVFYILAFGIIDFNLYSNQELVNQLSFYYGLIDNKEKLVQSLFSFVQTQKSDDVFFRKNWLELNYPASKEKIASEPLKKIDIVTIQNLREAFLTALIYFRREDIDASESILRAILKSFPKYENAEKLAFIIKSRRVIDSKGVVSPLVLAENSKILKGWRDKSEERYLLSEAYILQGKAAKNSELQKDGFYMNCPGRHFCHDTIVDFLENVGSEEAKNMAVFSKEKMGIKRSPEDIKLVMITAKKDEDYGNCYFAFKELIQFFPATLNFEILKTGAFCTEKQNYLEEAINYYEKVAAEEKSIEIDAKISELKYLQNENDVNYLKLKGMVEKGGVSREVLYSYLNILKKRENLDELVLVLDKIYELEDEENKIDLINDYLRYGAVNQAVQKLKQGTSTPGFLYKLYTIYNQYLLFEDAEKLDKDNRFKEKDKLASLKQIYEKIALKDYEKALQDVDSIESSQKNCSSPLLMTKAEIYRLKGDKNKTFSMLDALIECNKYYIPALMLAAEISFYQNDLKRAEDGLSYLLKNESFLSPIDKMYHNYLVLMSSEILAAKGSEKGVLTFLRTNLDKGRPLSAKERDKLEDVYDKLSPAVKNQISLFINSTFRKK